MNLWHLHTRSMYVTKNRKGTSIGHTGPIKLHLLWKTWNSWNYHVIHSYDIMRPLCIVKKSTMVIVMQFHFWMTEIYMSGCWLTFMLSFIEEWLGVLDIRFCHAIFHSFMWCPSIKCTSFCSVTWNNTWMKYLNVWL